MGGSPPYERADRAADRLPGPRGRWLSGNLQDFDEDRLGFLLRCRDRFGDLVRFDDRTTIVNEADLARTVLKGPDSQFQITENFLQQRLSLPDIESLLGTRSLLNPALRRSAVAGIRPLVASSTLEVLTMTAGSPVDPVAVLEQVTAGAVARYFFGDEGDRLPAACGTLLDALAGVIGNAFALPATWRTPVRRRIDRAHRQVHGEVVELLSRRLIRPDRYDDGAAAVARAASTGRTDISTERLANLVIGALLAAHRVPAAAAGWLIMLLTEHPGELEGIRTEVQRATGPAPGTLELDPHQLPHTSACVAESLRLYPPTWLLGRRVASGATLAGHRFEPGHHLVISPFVLGRDRRLFEEPGTFDPSRWRDPLSRASSFPFGSGPHGCPGSHLATSTLVTVATVVAGSFTIERCPGVVIPDARSTLVPGGLRIRFLPRTAGPVRPWRPSGPEAGVRSAATPPAG